tara:strand:- start:1857 stop:2771 length:915 start_codon:yes stop_codon:yes gene_type:complete
MNELEKDCKYVSSRGIAQNCDVYPCEIISDKNTLNLNDYKNIKNNDKVYVVTSSLHIFTKYVLPSLEENNIKIKLITGACVIGSPYEISNYHRINYVKRFFVESKSIICWFTQNYDVKQSSTKIIPIPLGLDYHTLQKKDHWWGPKQSAVKQDDKLDQLYKTSKNFHERIDKSFSYYQFQMFERHNRDRYLANKSLKDQNYNVFLDRRRDRDTTWKLCTAYKYIISPHGNGLDCHRTYEAMCLGCIPVVKSSSLDLIYRYMPVIILDDWKDISINKLDKISKTKIKNSRKKLMLQYWVDFINNY